MKYFIFFVFIVLFACKSSVYLPKASFSEKATPPRPDYSRSENWAALPTKNDMADRIPVGAKDLKDGQAEAEVDVFFLHPTIFTQKPENEYIWNADVRDKKMNDDVDNSTILNQATAFNGYGKVYAPRYRQAHLSVFYSANRSDAQQALDLAYEDVKAAFEHYLKNWNNGNPIIIASHSQGTTHATRLLQEYFDNGKLLKNKLVVAYLIGIATPADVFREIPACKNEYATGCFVSWNTYAKDFIPRNYDKGLNKALCINPLNWQDNDQVYTPKEKNLGGVGLQFKWVENAIDAQTHKGMLWVGTPNVRGAVFLKRKVWHKADINFFWGNIRQNTQTRIGAFWKN